MIVLAAVAAAAIAIGVGLAGAARSASALDWLGSLRGERFQLRAVEWLGLEHVAAGELLERAGLRGGTPLVDLDLATIEAAVAAHPRVARCRAGRLPPDRLLVEVEEREPLAVLEAGGSGVDAEGHRFPLAPGELETLPRLSGDADAAVPLLVAARDAGVALGSIRVVGAQDVRFVARGHEVEVRTAGDPARSLQDWTRLLASGLLAAHGARSIDLRFPGEAVLSEFDSKGGVKDGSS
jgi:hypothetical protein